MTKRRPTKRPPYPTDLGRISDEKTFVAVEKERLKQRLFVADGTRV